MPDGSLIPTPAPSDNVTLTITIDGHALSSEYNVLSVTVISGMNRIPQAKIAFLDGDPASQEFRLSNTDYFVPGKRVRILAGYHSNESCIFEGIVVKHSIRSRQNGPSRLLVECRHDAFKLTLVRRSTYFHNMTDSDIFSRILENNSLSAEIDATQLTHDQMVQYFATDWDFIVSRAEVNGMHLLVDSAGMFIKKPDGSTPPVLTLTHGSTMLEFEADIDARDQIPSVTARGWDCAQQEPAAHDGTVPVFRSPGNLTSDDLSQATGLNGFSLQHTGLRSGQELREWAEAQLGRSRLALVRGRVRFTGFADIHLGNTIELQGVGERFSGTGIVTAIRHEITGGLWTTDAQIGNSGRWFIEEKEVQSQPASGLLPAITGLQIGIVTGLAGDPQGEERILVRMPLVSMADDGTWARLASLDAGNERGAIFRPEIGDEVVLGFLNDDPRDPVVLGMLNSSAKPAPVGASDDNHIKGFVTRSKIKLTFNDETASVTLETPKGKKVQLDDDQGTITFADELGNKLALTSDGITIESAGNITIKSSGDLKFSGTNVQLQASGSLKAEGTGGAEIISSAITVVKGSMVQIN
ncbi:MAG: type VI secretion system tip protein VgrG [Pseudomonadota bacterium]